jgi:hypothetical protein
VLVLRRDAVALRGAARRAGVTVGHAYSDADPHSDAHSDAHAHAHAVYLLVEPASAAGARRFVVFVVRFGFGFVVRVLVRPRG